MVRLARCLVIAIWCGWLPAADTVQHPFRGVTYIERVETAPRALRMHVVKIDLAAPGIAFKLSPPRGKLETVRQTTLEFLLQEHAQIAVNAHYFLPWPSSNPEASLVGFAASNGTIYSAFEAPQQSYALTPYAPALNIDAENHASIVHRDPAFADGKHILERVKVWNAVSGSAQIVTGVLQREIVVRTDQRALGNRDFEGWRHAGIVHRGRPRRQLRDDGGRGGGRFDSGLRRVPGAQSGWRRIDHAGD